MACYHGVDLAHRECGACIAESYTGSPYSEAEAAYAALIAEDQELYEIHACMTSPLPDFPDII